MAKQGKNLTYEHNTYLVLVKVPAKVVPIVGKTALKRSLQTGDIIVAERIKGPIVAEFKKIIADARKGIAPAAAAAPDLPRAMAALQSYALTSSTMSDRRAKGPDDQGGTFTPWSVMKRVAALQRAVDDPMGWQEIPGFDNHVASILSFHSYPVPPDHPVIPMIRQLAATYLLYEAQADERAAIAANHRRIGEETEAAPVDSFGVIPIEAAVPRPAPALTLSKLHAKWLEAHKPAEKEVGRLNNMNRRLIEFVGDIPANYLEKSRAAEFITLLARFPLARADGLRDLPFMEAIERTEANAKLGFPNKTLSITTVGEWRASLKRLFTWAIQMDVPNIVKNPFDIPTKYVTGVAEKEIRAFTDDEIKHIFTQPLFTGNLGEGRYRIEPGDKLPKDVWYWLPILALFHGNRLSEFAEMPLADLKQTVIGTWYFDLTRRGKNGSARVKNRNAQRIIPLHPKMKELGFLDYVNGLTAGEKWLFPDLDHETKHGAGHAVSKWWGEWCDKIGLSDPEIDLHSLRHYWKQRAKLSRIKPELHNPISGHAGVNVVAERYGWNIPADELAKVMKKIEFPAFPLTIAAG